jgi:hypothetical protein
MTTEFVLRFVIPVVAGVVILLAGIISLAVDSRRKKTIVPVETQGWETTGGKIISVRLEQHEVRREDTAGVHLDINYEPIIEYVYTVKDIEYRSNHVFPGDHVYFGQAAAQEILDQHRLNSYTPVKYNPEDPAMSSLENRPDGENYVRLAGLVFTSLGVMVCCFSMFMVLIFVVGRY